MFCERCGDIDGDETGVDHDERECPWYGIDDTPVTVDAAELADTLAANADGSPALRAAIGLLAGHGLWIKRLAERPGLLLIDYSGPLPQPYGIDWRKVAQALESKELPASGGELRILALAASLADTAAPVRLGDAVSGLDAANLDLVLRAVAAANGRTLTR
ncbi:hypothetical protein ACF1HJ_23815 [Streptomyces sp. NPDC013978]|uniref:hypothetical protein n=1 Tax=Streptomyces sp. NPDC013978 TaxID=3364869 RepID=UPI0036FC2CBC